MELYNGDCLETLKSIPDDSVNLVLTDPPYNIAVKITRGGYLKPPIGIKSTVILTGVLNGCKNADAF